ncbi:helix-turn-helix transcriptional regulator [Phaeobacter italicus]|uniref:helix-turn-helix transcriptional regulator n=1 Tax=Phaeobacter italicus TaxID=481446 RepID=UPI001ADB58DC|nr:helix-turn-helix transcriptional regulator [Phaeobacter italicus]MBO9443403.1 helix-turn-helix transcriptional regulator [Phaeobacter italicus]
MLFDSSDINAANTAFSAVCSGRADASGLIAAASSLIPISAAFCVINRENHQPVYLADTYPAGAAKAAVQLYVESTYLLNPVYNAVLSGVSPGLHRMADLAPDNWNPASVDATVLVENEEEIGYRTPGWPAGLQELALLVRLPDGAMGELSMARPAVDGGFCDDHLNRLRPFLPLFECAFQQLWERQDHGGAPKPEPARLEAFGRDVLSTREAEVMQLILKGHSSLSISLTLGIAVPTVKTHRRNAYAKLGVSTQQQLFNAFLTWRAEDSSAKT